MSHKAANRARFSSGGRTWWGCAFLFFVCLFVYLFFLDGAIQLLVTVGLRLLEWLLSRAVLSSLSYAFSSTAACFLQATIGRQKDSWNTGSASLWNELMFYNHLHPIIFPIFYCLEANQRCFLHSTGKKTIGNGDRKYVRSLRRNFPTSQYRYLSSDTCLRPSAQK